jgi:hypothetical protein
VAAPGYTFTGPQLAGDIVDASYTPVPLEPGTVAGCQKYEYLGATTETTTAFTVADVLRTSGITLQQFVTWNNQSIDNPSTYAGGYWVCVGA